MERITDRNKHRQNKSGAVGRGTDKAPVLGMVERSGNVRTVHLEGVKGHYLTSATFKAIKADSRVITDSFNAYWMLKAKFNHEIINHSKDEYVRGDVHTNSVEGYFAFLKRGIFGIYHHVSKPHLQSYLDEFALRYNTRKTSTMDRFNIILQTAICKRLTYSTLINHE